MAIQLSARDNLIFKLLEEHQVLLEKHIAWFISCNDKPVLIRDRLRKLFYLDYLVCERHGGRLPWWTTPTKPLVYMLSPMTRQILGVDSTDYDLSDCDIQRHLLEIANLRMLILVDQHDGLINKCTWTTTNKAQEEGVKENVDAKVAFEHKDILYSAAIMNHPMLSTAAQVAATSATEEWLWIICRDEGHQQMLQQALSRESFARRALFAIHQDLYKQGIIKARWQNVEQNQVSITGDIGPEPLNWGQGLTAAPAV